MNKKIKYILGPTLAILSLFLLSQSAFAETAAGTLADAWNAIQKLQTDLKNIQFTSGLPGPKTIEFMNNVLIQGSSTEANNTTRWFEVSGGYNRIAFDIKKSGGATGTITTASIHFTNDPANPNPAFVEQSHIDCFGTKCSLTTLPILAKFYRISLNSDSGVRVSAYGYVSTEGLPGPKGPQGDKGLQGPKGEPGITQSHQPSVFDGHGQLLGFLVDADDQPIASTLKVFVPGPDGLLTIVQRAANESIELKLPVGNGIWFENDTCSGRAFLDFPFLDPFTITGAGSRFYKAKGIEQSIVGFKSKLEAGGNCVKQIGTAGHPLELTEIDLSYILPLSWPLSLK